MQLTTSVRSAVAPRLALQALAVIGVIFALPSDLHIVSFLPLWLERLLLVIGGVWFVNLVNFMDGIDWMTAAEIVPISAALVALGCLGALPRDGIAVALALGGAMIGFAYFNRPTAKLFLGDVGSLPIGLITGWLLVLLAGAGHLTAAAAAALLPRRCDADLVAPPVEQRARLAGAPYALLSARHRSRFFRHRDRRTGVRR